MNNQQALEAFQAELDMQALESKMWEKYQNGRDKPSEDERIESSAQRWQESQADQDYWQRRQAEGYVHGQDHSPTCNCPDCCGDEPSDSPDDPVCDCAVPMRSLQELFGSNLAGHTKDCKHCDGKGMVHITMSSQFCISCGHGSFIDDQGDVHEWNGWDGKDKCQQKTAIPELCEGCHRTEEMCICGGAPEETTSWPPTAQETVYYQQIMAKPEEF